MQLQEFVDVFKKANITIVRACERICDTPLIRMNDMHAGMDLYNIRCVLEDYRSAATVEAVHLYNGIIDMILVVYQGFEAIMNHVRIIK